MYRRTLHCCTTVFSTIDLKVGALNLALGSEDNGESADRDVVLK